MIPREVDKIRDRLAKMPFQELLWWRRYIKKNCPIPPFYQTEFAYYARMFSLIRKGVKYEPEEVNNGT